MWTSLLFQIWGFLAPVDAVMETYAKIYSVAAGRKRWGRGPPAVLSFPVRAAIFHSRYPLFWVVSKSFLLKLFWQPLRHHHLDTELLFQ